MAGPTMRVLVTGADGQLGHDVMASWGAAGDELLGTDLAELDITRRDQVHDLVAAWRPDVVVNCAAWTAVDACEADSERAHLANGFAVRWVAEACDAIGARLVHISTDYVFDGSKPTPYVETDEPNPQSVYGASKLMGEREALAIGDAATVVRTSWVCGAHGSNMVRTVQRLVDEGKPMAFVTDQVGHPTFTADLAPALRRLV
ncbi:MAG: NAD(P)-dependent oxidoreductase, partial [Actinomycetota bacterium]|nr:NAD(P)-dependent oxidoreductase [Actinomycetota bacterium]